MLGLIDTHCHLADDRLRPRADELLARARHAGVQGVVCAAADLNEAEAAMHLATRHPELYFAAGVHPHEAKDAPEGYLAQIRLLAGHNRNVAVGETGLDYHYDFSPRDDQRRVFAEQLCLAAQTAKPVIVHTREAFDETMAVLAESGVDGSRVVFHSFTAGAQEARRALEFGAMIGFSGIVTFKKSHELRRVAAMVPEDRILVETDSPYLSPEPVRKMKTNEPANVVHVARCLARVRGTAYEQIVRLTTANAAEFFALDLS